MMVRGYGDGDGDGYGFNSVECRLLATCCESPFYKCFSFVFFFSSLFSTFFFLPMCIYLSIFTLVFDFNHFIRALITILNNNLHFLFSIFFFHFLKSSKWNKIKSKMWIFIRIECLLSLSLPCWQTTVVFLSIPNEDSRNQFDLNDNWH